MTHATRDFFLRFPLVLAALVALAACKPAASAPEQVASGELVQVECRTANGNIYVSEQSTRVWARPRGYYEFRAATTGRRFRVPIAGCVVISQ